MSDTVITVDKLSKLYRIGTAAQRHDSLRELIMSAATAPLRRLRRLGEASAADAGAFWALKDVSFEVKRGEVLGIIGRNGAGKSTLLKILSRIVEPTEGRVRMRGRVASLLEVGTGFHPELTGRENIYLNGAILGMKKAEIDRKFDEIVAFSEIEKFLDTPVKRYSSGMYVRLAFAVAAHLDPEILICDEVLAVGDAAFQKKCLGKMQEVSRGQGRTVLFVSHNMAAVQNLCRRCVCLSAGQIAAVGSSQDVIADYLGRSMPDRSDGEATLLNHPGRRPGSKKLLLWVRVAPVGERRILRSGDDARIEIAYDSSSAPARLSAGFTVELPSGQRVFSVATYFSGYELRAAPSGIIRCDLRRLPLVAGTYVVNVGIGSGEETLLDCVYGACHFTVHPGDFYGTGRVQLPQHGPVLLDVEWRDGLA